MIYRGIKWSVVTTANGFLELAGNARCCLQTVARCPMYAMSGHVPHDVTVCRWAPGYIPGYDVIDLHDAHKSRHWTLAHYNARYRQLSSYDGVPWEIHAIEDEIAYQTALAAFLANT